MPDINIMAGESCELVSLKADKNKNVLWERNELYNIECYSSLCTKVPSYSLIVMVNNSKTFMVAILAQQLMKNGLMFGFSFSFMPPCPQCLLRSGTYISVWCHSNKLGLPHFLPNPGKGDPQFLKLWAFVYVLCLDKSPFQIFTLWIV